MKEKWFYDVKEITEDIFAHPELGFEEWRTSKLLKDEILKIHPFEFEDFARTGFTFTLPNFEEKKWKLSFIAELDAVYLPSHFKADKKTGAAHVCGHYTQVGIALSLIHLLMEEDAYKDLDYGIGFVFVPAEEYLDLEHRRELRDKKEISHLGGKPEAMSLGVFDKYDASLCVHAMGGEYPEPSVEFLSDLAGFLFKDYRFLGKASHAGFAPWEGKNAQSMSVIFQTALGLLRQQIDESKMIRINPVVASGPMGINTIADDVTIRTDLRSNDVFYMLELAKKMDFAARGAALCLEGEVEIDTEIGYLPFKQDRFLSELGLKYFETQDIIKKCYSNRPIAAAGDIGDLSFMIPSIQIGYSGFKGTIHGADFVHEDLDFILYDFPKFLLGYLKFISGKVNRKDFYKRSFEDYRELMEKLDRGQTDEK